MNIWPNWLKSALEVLSHRMFGLLLSIILPVVLVLWFLPRLQWFPLLDANDYGKMLAFRDEHLSAIFLWVLTALVSFVAWWLFKFMSFIKRRRRRPFSAGSK